MDGPPYQWRADGGYLGGPPPQQQQPATLFFAAPQPYVQYAQPQIFVPGPVGVYGIATQPQPEAEQQPVPAPKKKVCLPPPPPKGDNSKGSDKGDGKKEDKPKSNPRAPPAMMPGTNYMFPMEHTIIHIFKKGSKLWEKKYRGRQLAYSIFEVDTQKTVKAMLEYVVGTTPSDGPEKCKGWAATEMIEAGDGDWSKGTTIEYDSDRSNGTMAQMGWNARRGKELPPVWIAIHKV